MFAHRSKALMGGLVALSVSLIASLPTELSANPFFVGRFDGLLGGPLDDRPFALYWNPARLDREGLALDLHLGLISRQGSYDRVPDPDSSAEEAAVNGGLATTSALGALPSLAAQWGQRLSGAWRLGLGGGVYIARAGTADWDRHPDAPSEYPGAYDGPQRWSALSTSMLLLNSALGASIGYGPLSVGVSLNHVRGSLSTAKAANADKTEELVDPDGNIKEGRIFLDNATGQGFHVGAGAALQLERFELGVSWRQPVIYELKGTSYIIFGAQESQASAKIPLQVAGSLMSSLAYQLNDSLRLRVEYERQNWSIMDQQKIVSLDNGEDLLILDRQFKDTNAYRLRADYALSEGFRLHAGLSFEEGTTDEAYHEAGLAEHDQLEGGLGVTVALSDSLELHSAFLWQHFFDRVVTQSEQTPSTNGAYTDNRQYLTFDLTWRFGAGAQRSATAPSEPSQTREEAP